MKRFLLILVLFLGISDSLAENRWWTFSNPFPIRDAVAYGDGVMLATGGGLRYRTADSDYVFRNEDGLESTSFYGILKSEEGLLALSEYGQVVVFDSLKNQWRVLNSSYEANFSRVVPDAASSAKGFLVISFEDRLAFFDIDKASSILTIDRIGKQILSSEYVSETIVRDDSLFVRIGDSAYVRVMDWDDLAGDIKLIDPDSWTKIGSADDIDGLELRDSLWTVEAGKNKYEISAESISLVQKKKNKDLTTYEEFPQNGTYEMQSFPTGGIIVASSDGSISAYNDKKWNLGNPVYSIGNKSEALEYRMKVISTLSDGHVFYHVWGLGYFILNEWGMETQYAIYPEDSDCLDQFDDAFSVKYSVSAASIPAPDGSGFLTTTGQKERNYSLLYFTKQGEVHCASNIGSGMMGGPMYAKVDEDGSWVVYVGSSGSLGTTSDGNVDIIRFAAPKSNGNEITNVKVKTVRGITPTPIDMTYDSVGNRLWVASVNSVAYYDEEEDTLYTPTSMNGMMGVDISALEADVHGNLWVGTTNNGVYRLTQKGSSPDTLSTMHFTSKNGLLNNNVADLTIDKVNGIIWFAHDNGVSAYQRNDLRDASKNMTSEANLSVSAYPIPFRPKVQSFFTISNISESASVGIYNRGGGLVRSFRNEEVIGGRVEWNGQDKEGRLVAPGVYYYVVKTSSKVKKGKFLVIH